MRTILFLSLFLAAALPTRAQKTLVPDEQLWLAFFNQTRLSQRWGTWTDLHFRARDQFVQQTSLGIARVGLTYYLHDDVRLTAAYAYVHHFPADGHENTYRPEHRPWQQVQWFTRWPNVRLMQWVRLEERYRRKIIDNSTLGEGYSFNFRMRYNFLLSFPLTAKKFEPGGLQLALNDELMVNFGQEIVYNHFDQNRLFIGLVYPFSRHAQLQAGYMHLYLQQASGNVFRNQHTIRIFYFHNLDLRKKAGK